MSAAAAPAAIAGTATQADAAPDAGFDALRDLYQEVILEHGRRPRHMRRLEPADAVARGDNPMCGDRVEVRLRYGPGGVVSEAAFEARGCAISVASADLMAAAATGQGPAALRSLAARFEAMVRTGAVADARPDAADGAPACAECEDRLTSLLPLAGVHDYPSRIKCATLPWNALLAALSGCKEASRE